MKIKEVIVVEGRDDTSKIKQAVDADTIETNGSAINDEILRQIRHAKEKRGVIVFTDPDYPGQRIRSIIDQHIPGCKHAFLSKNEAKAKHNKGIGIEHASFETIQRALASVYELENEFDSMISREDLLAYGLLGGPKAKARREQLGLRLRIGYTNAKQLLKRLNMFQISRETFIETMNMIIQEEKS
ncbi:ribonuclease M5 [Aquibacillus sediminis]|uniref:ribonuclease M5 n=1 Tax=Aquibacillus sediminis TaxID=2574734 RepID=UPI0011092AF9|nr:ribonuclease M5 [Aquibacillus sediminis]